MLEKVRKARERKKYIKLPNQDLNDQKEAALIEFERWLTTPSKLLYSFIFGFLLTIIVYVAYTHSHGALRDYVSLHLTPTFPSSKHLNNSILFPSFFPFGTTLDEMMHKSKLSPMNLAELSKKTRQPSTQPSAQLNDIVQKKLSSTIVAEISKETLEPSIQPSVHSALEVATVHPTASPDNSENCPHLFINGSFEFTEEEFGGVVILTRFFGRGQRWVDVMHDHVERMKNTHLWGKYYIYILHNHRESDQDYTAEKMEREYGDLRKDCRVRIVDIQEQWDAMRPEWILGKNMEHEINKAIRFSGNGYRYMCHFWMGPVFDVPALKHLKYMMRIDGEDGFYKYDKEDPFLVMDKGPHGTYPYNYAYYWTGFDPPLYSVGLNEMMYDYVAKNNIKPYWDETYIKTKGKDRAPMFWTNWEITRTDYFRTKPVRDLANAIVDAKGIYEYRWGDAITRFYEVMTFSNDTQVWCVNREEIGYHHKREDKQPNAKCNARDDPRFIHTHESPYV